MGNKKGPWQAPEVLVLFAVLGSLGALFGFELGTDRGAFFFFNLLHAELLAFVFFDGAAHFVFNFLGSLLEFALGLTQAAGEFRELGTSEKEQDNEENNPDDWAIEYGKREVHGQIAIAVSD
jgi:hypothetical protein